MGLGLGLGPLLGLVRGTGQGPTARGQGQALGLAWALGWGYQVWGHLRVKQLELGLVLSMCGQAAAAWGIWTAGRGSGGSPQAESRAGADAYNCGPSMRQVESGAGSWARARVLASQGLWGPGSKGEGQSKRQEVWAKARPGASWSRVCRSWARTWGGGLSQGPRPGPASWGKGRAGAIWLWGWGSWAWTWGGGLGQRRGWCGSWAEAQVPGQRLSSYSRGQRWDRSWHWSNGEGWGWDWRWR